MRWLSCFRDRSGRSALACVFYLLSAGASATAAGGDPNDRIYFSKSFPESVPAYFEITLARSGKAVYKELPDDEYPVEFEVPGEEAAAVFALAESIERFRMPLNTERKVAFTGDKILRFESARGEKSEARFVYTEIPEAQKLLEWFEKAGESERHLIELERVARFDHLGVNKRLLQFQISLEKDRIIAPSQFLPILEKIVADKKIVQLARSRAAGLADRISRAAGGL